MTVKDGTFKEPSMYLDCNCTPFEASTDQDRENPAERTFSRL